MRKILELTEKEFLTGIAPSSQVQDKGLWHKAPGLTVVRNPFLESDDVGILQVAPLPVDLTGSVITGTPFAWTVDPVDKVTGFAMLYIWDVNGQMYTVDLSADNDPVAVGSPQAAGATAANGFFLVNHSNGAKNIWYFRKADIGHYGNLNGTPTFHTADITADIEDTPWHPTHQFFDRTYFGNGAYIGQAQDDGSGGLTVTGHALDLNTDERVNCLSDDGTFLVAGVTNNPTADPLTRGNARVIFWDTNQSSWQREWPIPDTTILAIRRVGSAMEAVTPHGVFAFNFSTPPQQVLPYFSTLADTPEYTVPTQFAVDVLGEALLFGGANVVSTFGKLTPAMPTAFFQPYAFGGGTLDVATLVIASAKTNNLFIGTLNGKFYRVNLSAAGLGTGQTAETIYIDLKRWWQVGRVVVGFDGQLQLDDILVVDLKPDDLSPNFQAGQAVFANNGAIRVKEMYCTVEAKKLKLVLFFNAGAPRIRSIEVWGDTIETPTHTRTNVGIPD